MIRVVLALLLTTALLGATLPALDDARKSHTETVVGTQLDTVERAARTLLHSDDPGAGARRTVTLRLPTESWTTARIDTVRIGKTQHEFTSEPGSGRRNGGGSRDEQNASGGRFTWTVEGGSQHVRYLPGIVLRTGDDTPVTFRTAGRHRLVLSLTGRRTAPVITVRQFTSDEVATPTHATMVAHAN